MYDRPALPEIRAALLAALRNRSLRSVAREVGIGAETLRNLVDGTHPRIATRRLLDSWYERHGGRQYTERDPVPAALLALTSAPEPRRSREPAGAADRAGGLAKLLREEIESGRASTSLPAYLLHVSAEVPEWVDLDDAADALAALVRAISDLHVALGGSGLVVDGMEVGTDAKAYA
ncbi:MAG: hypothetical protein JWM27_220 [Gemmatimonadetes bacterium]|nr:hypothetical protein [Gemmatimonadota bacterium]